MSASLRPGDPALAAATVASKVKKGRYRKHWFRLSLRCGRSSLAAGAFAAAVVRKKWGGGHRRGALQLPAIFTNSLIGRI